MSTPVIYDENYLGDDVLLEITESSEDSNFPVENIQNADRARVFRTNGYWNIESGSNSIIFSEDGAAAITATVAVSEYSSTSSFLQAVEDALNAAASTYTYTVAVDTTTGKILITVSGSPSAIVFYWSLSTAMADILGFDSSSDDTGTTSFLADALKIHTEEFIVFDLGSAAIPKAFALVGIFNETLKISSTATIKLQGNMFNSWGAPTYDQSITYNDKVLQLYDANGLNSTGLRFWRLSVVDPANAIGYVEISHIFLGDTLLPTVGAAQFPLDISYVDFSDRVISVNGRFFSSKRNIRTLYNMTWRFLTNSEVEEFDLLFDKFGTHTPFFINVDPDAIIGVETNDNLKLFYFTQAPKKVKQSPNDWTFSMELSEAI